jgi:hypothetical protein
VELLRYEVGRRRRRLPMALFDPEAPFAARFDAGALAQARHPMLATEHALAVELDPGLLRPIGFLRLAMHAFDVL